MNGAGALAVILILLGIGLVVAVIVAWCRIFSKANVHPGKFFIPVYGQYLTYDIANCSGLFFATLAVSIVGSIISMIMTGISANSYSSYSYYSYSTPNLTGVLIVYLIMLVIDLVIHCIFCAKLARVFGKNGGFAVGLIFLYPIFIMILGFGKAQYVYSSGLHNVPSVTATWKCPKCGTESPVSRGTCPTCGTQR